MNTAVLGRALLIAALFPSVVAAHIGSPNVYFQGNAGPYPVRVVIQPPAALPGRAEIDVVLEGHGAQGVTVAHALAHSSDSARPPSGPATPVTGSEGLYVAGLWLPVQGAYAVHVEVNGAHGTGRVVVPLNAVNQEPSAMPAWLQYALLLLGALSIAGVVFITQAIIDQSGLAPGDTPRPSKARFARWLGRAAGLLLAAWVVKDWAAWQQMHREYRENQLFMSLPITANIEAENGYYKLALARRPNERGSVAWPRLVTDHGKLMHVFLLREPGLDALAHLHPQVVNGLFVTSLPPLPSGRYSLYADITQEDGLSQTLTTVLALPDYAGGGKGSTPPSNLTDEDDSWEVTAEAAGTEANPSVRLGGDYRMVWLGQSAIGNDRENRLRFEVLDDHGGAAKLTPYMGMMGHAVVRRRDGAVFAHLHPMGSISMASQDALQPKTQSVLDDHARHAARTETNVISFPYGFPRNGEYRVWVQVKVAGQVMTGVFDLAISGAVAD